MTKNMRYVLLLLGALSLLSTACTIGNDDCQISFTVDGTPITLTSGDIPYLVDEYDYAYGGIDDVKTTLHVQASDSGDNNHFLRFYFRGTSPGTYDVDNDNLEAEYAIDHDHDVRYHEQDFTVTVLRLDGVGGVHRRYLLGHAARRRHGRPYGDRGRVQGEAGRIARGRCTPPARTSRRRS